MANLKHICLLLALLLVSSECSKILFLLPIASKSHKNVFDPLIQELASRGHDITVISPYKETKPLKNIHEIVLSFQKPEDVVKGFFTQSQNPLKAFFEFKYFFMPICELYLTNPEVRALLKKGQQFDTVIVNGLMNDCALATATNVSKTFIWLSPGPLMSWVKFFVPRPASYVPNTLLPYTAKMNFFQRLNNVFHFVAQHLIMDYHFKPAVDSLLQKHAPGAVSADEAMKKVDFVLANVDPVLVTPRPTMPNIVNIGGMHCVDAKPLNEELEDFAQSSGDDGFVLFSLGSNVEARFLPPEKKEAFIKALGSLKQKVIWKYEENLDNLPANIKITQWLPQQDLLGHPKCKLFITHGGLLSLQEGVYHGVPVLVIPLFADQPGNAARVDEIEIGKKIEFSEITTETFSHDIKTILNDKKYQENVKKYSAIFRDQYQRPEKRAAFWVEYVIRHEGAKHFRSAGERLNFFQYFLLDVMALLAAVTGVVTYVTYKSVRCVVRKIRNCKKCGGKSSDKSKKE